MLSACSFKLVINTNIQLTAISLVGCPNIVCRALLQLFSHLVPHTHNKLYPYDASLELTCALSSFRSRRAASSAFFLPTSLRSCLRFEKPVR